VFEEYEFDVINLAHGGYNARQELIVASIWGPMLLPNMLLSLDGANDMIHRLRMTKPGSFYLDDAYRLALTRPLMSPLVDLLRYSQLRNGIVALVRRQRIKESSHYTDAIPIFVNAQHSMNVLAKGLNATRAMVMQPFHAFKKPMTERERAFTYYNYRKTVITELYSLLHKELVSLSRRDGVMYLDGRHIYDGVNEHIFSDDVHFANNRGYEMLAKAIVVLVKEGGAIM